MKAGDWDCFCFRWFVMIVIVECGVGFVATDVVLSLNVVLLVLSPLVGCCLWMWCCWFCRYWCCVVSKCGAVGFVAAGGVLPLDVVLLVLSPLVWCCLWMWCCGVGNGAVC